MRTSNIIQDNQSSLDISENAIAMSIDEYSSVFLMDAMGKLYSRPAQAALREYLSNAIDAHKAKGGTLPHIRINLPNGKNGRILSIRDFGHGMSEVQVVDILSRYGASTKRESNELIGGFGLGAKSGFAISNEFFITSFQHGESIRYRIFKDAKNQGYIEAMERSSTSDPDGLLVEVPIRGGYLHELSPSSLIDVRFFLGYGFDEIHVDMARGVSVFNPQSFHSLDLGDETVGWLSVKNSPEPLRAVIGKVSYNIDTGALLTQMEGGDREEVFRFRDTLSKLSIFKRAHVINVPISSVDLPSSREEISYTERSISTLVSLISNYSALVKQKIQQELNQKATRIEVLNYMASLMSANYSDSDMDKLTWRGEAVSLRNLKSSTMKHYTVYEGVNSYNSGGRYDRRHNTPLYAVEGNQITSFSHLVSLQSSNKYGNGIYRIEVNSDEEVKAVDSLLTEELLQAFINTKGKKTSNNKRQNKSFSAIFYLMKRDDVIKNWLFAGTPITIDELEVISAKHKEVKKAQQEEQKKKDDEREFLRQSALQEKKALNEGMLSYFRLEDSEDSVYHNEKMQPLSSKRPLFYWSRMETLKLPYTLGENLKERNKLLFPFKKYRNAANNFTILTQGSSNSSYANSAKPFSYLTKLRPFLNLFLPSDSLIILLDSDYDLNKFKAENPHVKSGVDAIKTAVAEDFAKPNPTVVDIISVVNANTMSTDFAALSNLFGFISSLSEKEKVESLNETFAEATKRLSPLAAAMNNQDGWKDTLFISFIRSFSSSEAQKIQQSLLDDIRTLADKYPLLLEGAFIEYSTKVKESMFRYIRMCDEVS